MGDDEKQAQDEPSLADYFQAAIDAATDAAREAVTPHIDPESTANGNRFPLDGKVYRLSEGAPQSARCAAAFLAAQHRLRRAHRENDIGAAIHAAFLVGVGASDTWLAGAKGWSLAEMVSSAELLHAGRQRGGRNSGKWTPDVEAIARPIFERHFQPPVTKHAAAQRTWSELQRDHKITDISLTTVKRGLGVIK